MTLYLDGHDMSYETGNLCYMFFPGERLLRGDCSQRVQGDFVYVRLKKCRGRTFLFVTLSKDGEKRRSCSCCLNDTADYDKQCEFALGRAFYKAASRLCGFLPPWGILTGIRPAKLAREMAGRGMSREKIAEVFIKEHYLSPVKAAVCLRTAEMEESITALSRPESVSLYISIPFCPSRCLYCSFISQDVERMALLLPRYVELLCDEIKVAAALIDNLKLKLETIYIGGGTPTSLPEPLLKSLLDTVKASFTLDKLREYTVEAGRPDTITSGKLAAIRAGGVGRVCINPQTLDDDILKNVGRRHTAKQFFDSFALARAAGIRSINTDLIAGLPGDTPAGFKKTLDSVTSLAPEGITIHTLAMKRSSGLVTGGGAPFNPRGEAAAAMLDYAAEKLSQLGYIPYYLYRQRNTVGNLENIGYSVPGFEGLYNIFIMDETHTILSCGAGGVTKLRQPNGSHIERIFNFKYPYEYISRFEEILNRKKQVEKFYDDYTGKD